MILFILSFLIVAFGQPAWVPVLGPLAALVGYAFFWKACIRFSSPWRRFWIATGWFVLVQAIQLSWMTTTEYQGSYILLVYGFVLFWLGIQFGLLTLLIPQKGKLSLLRLVTIAAVWTLFEWSRLHYFFCGFSWNPVGLALTSLPTSLQFASVWGVFGLSFWVMIANVAGLRFLIKRSGASLCWLALLGFLPYLFGTAHLLYHEKKVDQSSKLSVALLGTQWLPPEKIFFKERAEEYIHPLGQWRHFIRELKDSDRNRHDMIILPEAAVPMPAMKFMYPLGWAQKILIDELGESVVSCFPDRFIDEKREYVSNLFFAQTLSNFYSADLIIGLDHHDELFKKNYQSAFFLAPNAPLFWEYKKRVLVPLAEYLPFEWLRSYTQAYGITEFYTHGTEAKVFNGKVPFSLSICYEQTFPELMREGRVKGANLFVNVTNDNWYPHSRLAQQHFTHALLRSVENGVPLLRVSNLGVSAAVDSLGRVFSGKKFVDLPIYQHATLYSFWGDLGILAPSFIFVLISCFVYGFEVKNLAQKA